MKASDLIQLLEYGKAFKEPKAKRSSRKKDDYDFDLSKINITALLHHEIEKAESLKKLLADYEKANKKEDKPKDGWSVHHISTFMWMTFPITGPLMYLWFKFVFGH